MTESSESQQGGKQTIVAQAQPPLEPRPPRIKTRKKFAAGIPGVLASFKHGLREMGLLRSLKTFFKINQKDGFDCMGCAWPDPEERKTAEFCENGAKAVAEEATLKRVDPSFFQKYSVEKLSKQSDYWLGKAGRITQPVWLRPGGSHYEAISWEKAFEMIAEELNALQSPDEAAFYTSGRTSNEAAFLYQLFVRLYGTNNLPDCSNMCHESSGVAMKESLGNGKGSVTLEDFEYADCIVIIGQNPGTNHPRMLSTLKEAARRGCEILVINPLPEAGNQAFRDPQEVSGWIGPSRKLETQYLQVRVNGDVAALKGMMKVLFDEDQKSSGKVLDWEFIRHHTKGIEELRKDLEQTSWELILRESGLTREEIEAAARRIAKSKRMIACWAMGLTQHDNAVGNIQEIINLLLLGGHIGRRGAGACPVRGHSNVQGDRTMGIWEKPTESFLNALEEEFGFKPPHEHGLDTVGSIRAMQEGKIKVFFAMGGNFLSATSDSEYTAQALRKCRLTAHVSTKLNRSHLVTGQQALILPCLGRTEIDEQESGPQFVTVENSMSLIHSSRGNLAPASEHLRSEPEIVCRLAEVVFQGTEKQGRLRWSELYKNYDRIRDHIAHVIPGFEDFNRRIRDHGSFYLPHAVRDRREFLTSSGKAEFRVHPIPQNHLEEGEYLMTTIRSHDQFNTTIYGLHDRYRGVTHGRRVIFMNQADMDEMKLEQGDRVDIVSRFADRERWAKQFAVVPYSIPRKCVASYFPEANVLVPHEKIAEKSHTPSSKSFIVRIESLTAQEKESAHA